jgi:hypothetical protein
MNKVTVPQDRILPVFPVKEIPCWYGTQNFATKSHHCICLFRYLEVHTALLDRNQLQQHIYKHTSLQFIHCSICLGCLSARQSNYRLSQ